MKIGELVKYFIPKIIEYCTEKDHDEIGKLQDLTYSKRTFGVSSYPFWSKVDNIGDSKRFWTTVYVINGANFRVSSQWTIKHIDYFKDYLLSKGIATKKDRSHRNR